MLSIDKFKAAMIANPLLDGTKYSVMITGPVGTLNEDLSRNCNSVNIPGRGFSTVEKFHHGPIRKVPYMELYDDITTSFYVTDKMLERQYFDKWQLQIAGKDYYLGWYSDIVGTVVILSYNKKGAQTSKIVLQEAYPISIGTVTHTYQGEEIPLLEVTWAYHIWE